MTLKRRIEQLERTAAGQRYPGGRVDVIEIVKTYEDGHAEIEYRDVYEVALEKARRVVEAMQNDEPKE